MATISSSPSPTLLSPPLLPPAAANNLNPIILIIILLLLIAVLFSLPLLRHLNRRTTAAIISPSAANRRYGNRNLPEIFASSSSSGYCAVCLSEIGRRDLLRRLPVCRHGFHVNCIETWLRFNQTCPLCRSPVHGGGAVDFRPGIGSGD